ncbi:MAG: hypothetical protein CMM87_05840 [Rickettsiales bacterium]|nr:hypothetical protein [Rickettsiales bacterium]|tara:strand:+ start:8884 stop:9696 length:813 start_codon:yes stop_codon:yes gene_type:complete
MKVLNQSGMRWFLALFVLIHVGCFIGLVMFDEESLRGFNPQSPNLTHIFGTTTTGLDIGYILANSIPITLWFLTLSVGAVFCFALCLGIVFGYCQRLNSYLPLLRIIEMVNSIPMLMVLVILGYYHWLFWGTFLILLVVFKWPLIAQIVQGLTLSQRRSIPVMVAQNAGFQSHKILRHYFLPKIFKALMPKVPTLAISIFNTLAIMDYLGYSFIGAPSLGSLIAEGKDNLYAPWILLSGLGGLLVVNLPFIIWSFLAIEPNDNDKRLTHA